MFERYTEDARRILFFARYEASRLGSITIAPEHLLLGILKEGKNCAAGAVLAASGVSLDELRKKIEGNVLFHEKISTSVEIPFDAECKRVLQYAAQESDDLGHSHIGSEHLLLALLREENAPIAQLLTGQGLHIGALRGRFADTASREVPDSRAVLIGQMSQRPAIEDIKEMIRALADEPPGERARQLRDQILARLDALR